MTVDNYSQPWQLDMFRRSIKKQRKLDALLAQLGDTNGKECLFITCGDNNGALNWYFRAHGGRWTWADVLAENNQQIAELLGEPVHELPPDRFPFPDGRFDCVLAIDVLEHLPHDQPFLRESNRVLKVGGRALVTVPNGDSQLLANRIKVRIGMTQEVYGHTRAGYTLAELTRAVSSAGLRPVSTAGYSRFFTEMVELVINYGYVKILSRKSGGAASGHIAPVSSQDINTHGMAYRLYSIFYPVARALSSLDLLLSQDTNNAVIVLAEKGASG